MLGGLSGECVDTQGGDVAGRSRESENVQGRAQGSGIPDNSLSSLGCVRPCKIQGPVLKTGVRGGVSECARAGALSVVLRGEVRSHPILGLYTGSGVCAGRCGVPTPAAAPHLQGTAVLPS